MEKRLLRTTSEEEVIEYQLMDWECGGEEVRNKIMLGPGQVTERMKDKMRKSEVGAQ